MPTLADLLKFAATAFGEGALHNRNIATQGGDYLQRRELGNQQILDAETRRAMQMAEIARARTGREGMAKQAAEEFPQLAGVGTDEAVARFPMLREKAEFDRQGQMNDIRAASEDAQAEAAIQRATPQPPDPLEQQKLQAQIAEIMARTGKVRAEAGQVGRPPAPRPADPARQRLDRARVVAQLMQAGLSPEEAEAFLAEKEGATPTAAAAPGAGRVVTITSPAERDALPPGTRFQIRDKNNRLRNCTRTETGQTCE
jgi:hypothetical protein